MNDLFGGILQVLNDTSFTFDEETAFTLRPAQTPTSVSIYADPSVENIDEKVRTSLKQLITSRPELLKDVLLAENLKEFVLACQELDEWLYDRDLFIYLGGRNLWTDIKLRLMVKNNFFFNLLS